MSWIRASSSIGRARRLRLAPSAAVAAVSIAAIAAIASIATEAFAQARSGDAAMAETLFTEAKARMAAGDFATACPKLAESYRLDPGSGTLTALAVCHESQGKTASAWTEFIEVVSEARQAGRADREKFAQQHVDTLAPKLSKLTVVIDPVLASAPGLEVRRDGTVLGPAGWATAAPVDPGPHTVDVLATGKKPWSATVTVGAQGDAQTVTIPELEDAPGQTGEGAAGATPAPAQSPDEAGATPQSAASPSPEQLPSGTGNTQRTVGIVVGGAGIVAAAVGTYFGLQAISKRHQASSACPPPSTSCSDMSAVSSNDDAKSAAVTADVLFGGALVAVGVGAILYLVAPTAPPPGASSAGLRLVPIASTRGASVVLDGRW